MGEIFDEAPRGVDGVEAMKRAIVEVALRGEYRAEELNRHFHEHIEELDAGLFRVSMYALVGIAYGALALWLVGTLAERVDKLEARMDRAAGAPIGPAIGAN